MTTFHFHSWFAVKTGLKEIIYSISVQIRALDDSVDPFEKVITVYGWGALARNMKIPCEIDLTKVTDQQLGRFIKESNYNWFFSEEEPEDPG